MSAIRRHRLRFVVLTSAAGLLGCLFAASAGAASPARIEGAVRGLPAADSRAFVVAEAVQVTDGRIVAAQQLGAGSRYALRVKPGLYVVLVRAVDAKGYASTAFSRLVVARSGRTARNDLRVEQGSARPAAPVRSSAAGAERTVEAASASVVAIDDIKLGYAPVENYVASQVLAPLNGGGGHLVDGTSETSRWIHVQERLAAHGRTDIRFQFHPLRPQFRISGTGHVVDAAGNGVFELNLIDVATDKTLVHTEAQGPGDARYGYGRLVAEVTAEFKGEMLKAIEQAGSGAGQGGGAGVPVRIQLAELCSCGPGSAGTVTATPPGLTANQNDATVRTDPNRKFTLPAGTTVTIEAKAAPGYFLLGLTGSCVFDPRGSPGTQVVRFGLNPPVRKGQCTIVQVGDHPSYYSIGAGATFHHCPDDPASLNPLDFPFAREDCTGFSGGTAARPFWVRPPVTIPER